MSLNQAVSQHFDNCANKQEPSGITPSSSYTFAIYNSARSNWSIGPNEPTPLSKSPSPISSLTDGDSGNGGGGSSSSGTGSGTGAISWGSTKVICSSSSGATTASTCQRSSIITTCSSTASSTPSISTTTSPTNVRRTETETEAAKSSSPTTTTKCRKTIKFADSATTCSNYTTNGTLLISSSDNGETVVDSASVEMSTHQNSTSSSTINTPAGMKPPSSPVKNVGSGGGVSGSKSKSRHASTSDSTCVTPTGSSSTGGGLAGASNVHGITVGADGIDKAHSIRVTRKIFNNWRSACGRTKDKTKDFIRRWKTLPENQSESEAGDSGEQLLQHTSSVYEAGGNVGLHGRAGGLGHSMDQSGGIGGASSGGGFTSLNNTNTGTGASGGGAEPSVPTAKPSSGFGKIRSLTKKFSQDIPSEEVSTSSISKPSAGWSVHVWATYVQRGLDDEDALSTKEEEKPGRDLLSDFQKTKLTHFFRHVLDMNHDDVISAADFVALNQRIRHYIEWSTECIEFHVLKEVHSGFLECFLNQPLDDCSDMYYCNKEKETRDHVNLDEWLDVWGKLLETARTLEDLPLWLQYFPKIIFQVINKSGSQKISKEELRAFYTMFLGIDFRVVNETLDSIYNAMTDGGKNPITYHLFKLCFANFLLGRYPHGPGQYMFGICQPQSLHCNFPIDYSALNTPTDDLKPYDPSKDRDHSRRSVIV